MKEDKNLNVLNLSEDEMSKAADKIAVTEDNFSNAVDKSQDYTDKALNDELERLAQTFQEELKKAQSMTEEELIRNGIIIQQYEDDQGVIPEDELCQCCGENRRDKTFGENYEYCKACREAMRSYPLSISGIITLAAMVFIAVVSVFSFAADFSVYDIVRQADSYLADNKVYTAMDNYDTAIATFESAGITPKRLYLKTARLVYNTMPEVVYSFADVNSRIKKGLSDFELGLPIYGSYASLNDEVLTMQGTFNEFYNIMNSEEYADYDINDDKQYEEIMTAIGSIIDKQVSITRADKSIEMVKSNETMVRFCQYMVAYTAKKYDDAYKYMNIVYELEPSYLWLYAYELGITELQKGDIEKAEMFAKALYNSNKDLQDGYVLYSSIARMTGDYDGAIEWAGKGVKEISDSAELYRIKAMAYIAKGDFESAKEFADKGLEKEEYSYLYMVSLVIENELGNEDRVKEIKKIMKDAGMGISDKTQKYLKGKITAKEMFTEGTGDVE